MKDKPVLPASYYGFTWSPGAINRFLQDKVFGKSGFLEAEALTSLIYWNKVGSLTTKGFLIEWFIGQDTSVQVSVFKV